MPLRIPIEEELAFFRKRAECTDPFEMCVNEIITSNLYHEVKGSDKTLSPPIFVRVTDSYEGAKTAGRVGIRLIKSSVSSGVYFPQAHEISDQMHNLSGRGYRALTEPREESGWWVNNYLLKEITEEEFVAALRESQ